LRLLSYSTCSVVQEGDTGNATEAHANLIFNNKSGIPGAHSSKAKAAIVLVGASDGVQAEVRLYDCLFSDPHPDAGRTDFFEALNLDSLKVVRAYVELSLVLAQPSQRFQLERHGYFVTDHKDHSDMHPVFNLAVRVEG
jgi:glutaminyl-tRNA synthetase